MLDKSLLIGTVVGAVGVTAGGAIAGYQIANRGPDYAEVLNAQPVYQTVETPRKECRQERVTHTAPPRDRLRLLGTAAGAALGGLVGSQFGGGAVNAALTAVGVVGGGVAGHAVQGRMQRGHTYTTTRSVCRTFRDSHDEVIGYDVSYRLGEQHGIVRMDRDPGLRIPIADGQLVLRSAAVQTHVASLDPLEPDVLPANPAPPQLPTNPH